MEKVSWRKLRENFLMQTCSVEKVKREISRLLINLSSHPLVNRSFAQPFSCLLFFANSFSCLLVLLPTHSLANSFTCQLVLLSTRFLVYSFSCLHVLLPTHSLANSFTCQLVLLSTRFPVYQFSCQPILPSVCSLVYLFLFYLHSPLYSFSFLLVLLSTRLLVYLLTCLFVGFCPIFSKYFNIMSAFSFTNRSPSRKKSILAKVGFDAKRRQSVSVSI